MVTILTRAFAPVAVLALAAGASAQAGEGGTPPSFQNPALLSAPTVVLPRLDVERLLLEDAESRGRIGPFRFGHGHEVGLGIETTGLWEDLPGGWRLWRLRVQSAGALSLNLIFDRYRLPEGARLWIYDDAHEHVLGAFSSAMNRPHGMFASEPVRGDALTLEYLEPASSEGGELRLSEVIHAYRDVLGPQGPQLSAANTMAASGSCNINVNCPLGAGWQDQKRSAARLVMGGVLCSGALITNTAQNGKQYFLTANHCYSGNPASWVFNFNYESPTCSGTSGTSQSVTGSTLKVKNGVSDFCVVEITQAIPPAYNVYLSGWSRSTSNPANGTGIHHPQGDIKKICHDDDALTPATVSGVQTWRVADWEQGVTEGGSSGSPIFDQSKRIVGQLWGGQATCGFLFNDYYGRFSVSMPNGLSAYLDPTGSGAVTMDGMNAGYVPPVIYCTSKVSSSFLVPLIGYTGQPKLSTNNFIATLADAEPQKSGLVFWSSAQAAIPFHNAWLCVQPPIQRGPVTTTSAAGAASYPVSITAGMVGTTQCFQWWFRDPLDAYTDGLSNAMSVTWSN